MSICFMTMAIFCFYGLALSCIVSGGSTFHNLMKNAFLENHLAHISFNLATLFFEGSTIAIIMTIITMIFEHFS